jgi:hypothetical protein
MAARGARAATEVAHIGFLGAVFFADRIATLRSGLRELGCVEGNEA